MKRADVRDSVDEILEDWAVERPDLDFRPVAVITRLARLRSRLDGDLAAVFARNDLSAADFQVVVTLRRAGRPYRLGQARLASMLGLTSGTVSVRIDRLVRRGVVERQVDPSDARGTLVRLTESGQRLFDEIAPVHLANEDRLLSALDVGEREQLAELLRRVLASFEQDDVLCAELGLRLEPAHVSRARRAAVGLSDAVGLLVAEVLPGSPAESAGAAPGDLVVAVDGMPVRDAHTVHAAAAARPSRLEVLRGESRLVLGLPAGVRRRSRSRQVRPPQCSAP